MAKVPCGITFDGKKYTPEQFMSKLMDGSLDEDIMLSGKATKPNIQSAKERLAAAKEKAKKAYENLGIDPFEQKKLQAQADREVFDAYVDLAKEYIKEGVQSVKDFAAELGEDVNDLMNQAWTEAVGGEGVKRTFVTKRAYEGEVREETKRQLEKYGLTREIESQEDAAQAAKAFIQKVGEDAALDAVRNGDVNGGQAAAVFGSVLENIDRRIAAATPEETASLVELQGELMDEFDRMQTFAGRQSAMMKYIYKHMDIGYNLQRQIEEYKNANNGEISPELEAKFKEWDEELKAAKKKIAELEEEARTKEEKAAVANIKESVEREKKIRKPRPAVYGKTRVAKGLDDLASALGAKLSATGAERASVTQALTDIGQGLIEEGVATTENVAQKIREYISQRFGDKLNFDDYEGDVVANIANSNTAGEIKLSNSMLRDFVEQGIDNIEDLTAAVKDAIKDQYPNATDRQIRDAITGYGKTVNPNRDEISTAIRKMRRIGRVLSGLEDVQNKKRPLRSGQQRDKLDAEERALQKELREAMKDLPVDEADIERQLKTQLDAAKSRLQNQIEDLEREIQTGEQVPKSTRSVQEDAELKALKEKRDKLKEEHDNLFKDEEYQNQKRVELAKKATQKRIEDLEKRLREGDFSKKERKPILEDTELTKWRAKEIEIRERYEKEKYKAELRNRTKAEKIKEGIWDLWQVPRALLAGFEFSFVGVQGLKLTLSNLISNPRVVVEAFGNAIKSFASEKKQEEWMRQAKAQEWYPVVKKSGLALTEPSPKALAAEELFYTGWMDAIWRGLGKAALSMKSFDSQEKYEEAVNKWTKVNPMKPFERAAVGYLNTLRLSKFQDGSAILEQKGLRPDVDAKEYKQLADYINTMTGRASLGALEKNAQVLTNIFFSPRNWASGIKLGTPYAAVYFANQTPTVRKMALMDMSKFLGLTTSMVALAAVKLNNDDDDETGVSFDPRSSDFMKIKLGRNRVVDPWGGMQQQIVFSTRLVAEAAIRMGITDMKGSYVSKGEEKRLGAWGVPTQFDLMTRQATNKLNPSAKIFFNYLSAKVNKKGELTDSFGKEYTFKSEVEQNMLNIYAGTLIDLLKDDPQAMDGFLAFYAVLGGGVNVEEETKKKETSSRPKRPSRPERPKRP